MTKQDKQMNANSDAQEEQLKRSFLKQNFGINVRSDLNRDPVPAEESHLIDESLSHLTRGSRRNIYAINCQLDSPLSSYPDLVEALRSFPCAQSIQNGFWLVQSTLDKGDMFSLLSPLVQPDDALFIMKYSNGGASWTANQNQSDSTIQGVLNEPNQQRTDE
jgi:hypothetical protein